MSNDRERGFDSSEAIDSSHDAEVHRLRKKEASLNRHLFRMRLSVRIIHLPVAIANLALMALTLQKYYQTANVSVDQQPLWPPENQTVKWPTIFTLSVAAIEIITACIVLVAYYWSHEMATKMDTWRTYLDIVFFIINLILASVVAPTMYLSGNNNNSLWGVSCAADDAAVALYSEFLNLGSYCIEQNLGAWLAFIGIGLEFIGLVTYIIDFIRWRYTKKIKRHDSEKPSSIKKSDIKHPELYTEVKS